MAKVTVLLLALCATVTQTVLAVTISVPSKVGTGGYSYAPLDPAPLGLSFEFFAFPSYFTNVTATNQCLAHWKDLTGTWPPIRIGGTTQDRASYDASTQAYVVYRVANAADAPMTLTFGPRFMTLAGTYPGRVVVGLNRGKNDLDNTIAAAKVAVAEIPNLLAIELGNEPECMEATGTLWPKGTYYLLTPPPRLPQGRTADRAGHVEPVGGRGIADQLGGCGGASAQPERHHPGGQLEPGAAGVGGGAAGGAGRGFRRHWRLGGALHPALCAPQLPGRVGAEAAGARRDGA